jgi:hypothetical protein
MPEALPDVHIPPRRPPGRIPPGADLGGPYLCVRSAILKERSYNLMFTSVARGHLRTVTTGDVAMA